jgi:hypothetical protein
MMNPPLEAALIQGHDSRTALRTATSNAVARLNAATTSETEVRVVSKMVPVPAESSRAIRWEI